MSTTNNALRQPRRKPTPPRAQPLIVRFVFDTPQGVADMFEGERDRYSRFSAASADSRSEIILPPIPRAQFLRQCLMLGLYAMRSNLDAQEQRLQDRGVPIPEKPPAHKIDVVLGKAHFGTGEAGAILGMSRPTVRAEMRRIGLLRGNHRGQNCRLSAEDIRRLGEMRGMDPHVIDQAIERVASGRAARIRRR